jgi:hypothetical protein
MTHADDFLTKTLLQAEINRTRHGDEEKAEPRKIEEWAMIAGEHMGHLMGAVLRGDAAAIEREVLHVAAPLLELHDALQRMRKEAVR